MCNFVLSTDTIKVTECSEITPVLCHKQSVRVAWGRAGQWQCYDAHFNWICQNSPPVNVVPLLGKAAACDPQLSRVWSMGPFAVTLLLLLHIIITIYCKPLSIFFCQKSALKLQVTLCYDYISIVSHNYRFTCIGKHSAGNVSLLKYIFMASFILLLLLIIWDIN